MSMTYAELETLRQQYLDECRTSLERAAFVTKTLGAHSTTNVAGMNVYDYVDGDVSLHMFSWLQNFNVQTQKWNERVYIQIFEGEREFASFNLVGEPPKKGVDYAVPGRWQSVVDQAYEQATKQAAEDEARRAEGRRVLLAKLLHVEH